MTVGRARRALLLVSAAAVAIGTASACSLPVIAPRDQCRTVDDDSLGSASTLAASGPIGLPVAPGSTSYTSGFGPREGTQHQGVDLAGPIGTPILAALDGTVVESGTASGFGHWIVVDSNVDGKPVSTVYGHMFENGLRVKAGQQVKAGDHIADIGNDGESTGAHLHFEYWNGGRLQGGTAVDPVTVLPELADPTAGGPNSDQRGDVSSTQVSDTADSNPVKLAAVTRSTADCAGFGTAGGADLAAGVVPAEFEPWLRRAGSVCPEIDTPLLAAQLQQENNFRHGEGAPVSPSGAMGPAQFMPGTWATWGKDYDGDGQVDPNSIGDAVMSQAAFMCALHQEVSSINGDPIALTLAAYNAGSGAVQHFKGVPPYAETENYVAKIIAARAKFVNPNSQGRFVPRQSGDSGQAVSAAREYLGTPYVWGGGGSNGPTNGGFDCSGLTSYAVHAASGGKVTLPRTSEEQWTVGSEIPINQAQPGDLVFGSWSSTGPGHVGIYSGNGQMVHAPTTDDVVKEAPLMNGMKARRVM